MPSLKIKRGTRSQVTTAGAASGLAAGELYLVTDESRVDVGTSATASTALAKKSEVDAKQDTITATGILKGAGAGSISAATAGTDYASPSQTFYIGTTQVAINRASAALTLAGITLTTPTLTGTKETRVAMAANAVDLSTGNYFTKTISGNTTLTVSNTPASGTSVNFILDLTNGGSATITWWSGMKWVAAVQPTLTASGRDVLGFFTHDGGTTWTGLLLGRDVR